jgi:hypothetical protein
MNRHNGLPTRRGRRRKSGSFQQTTTDLAGRIAEHRAGQGSRLLAAVAAAGIGFTVARTWPGGRELERRLKRRHNSPRLCPICSPLRRRQAGAPA